MDDVTIFAEIERSSVIKYLFILKRVTKVCWQKSLIMGTSHAGFIRMLNYTLV